MRLIMQDYKNSAKALGKAIILTIMSDRHIAFEASVQVYVSIYQEPCKCSTITKGDEHPGE